MAQSAKRASLKLMSRQQEIVGSLASLSKCSYFIGAQVSAASDEERLFVATCAAMSRACQPLRTLLSVEAVSLIVHYSSTQYAEELIGYDFALAFALLQLLSKVAHRNEQAAVFPDLGISLFCDSSLLKKVEHTEYAPFGLLEWGALVRSHPGAVVAFREFQGVLPFGVEFGDKMSCVLTKLSRFPNLDAISRVGPKLIVSTTVGWRCVFSFGATTGRVTACSTSNPWSK